MKSYSENFKVEFKKRQYNFALKLIDLIDSLPKDNVSNRLGDQLLRSGTSVIANYIEGQSASSKKEFINFLNIALKSANESKVWLALLRDSKRLNNKKADWFLNEIDEISKILASSLITLKNKRKF